MIPSPEGVAFTLLMASWLAFTAAFVLRVRPPTLQEAKRDRAATLGIVLQMVAYGFVWGTQRRSFGALLGAHTSIGWQYALAGVVGLLAGASAWMTFAAIRTLGKQWALAARLVETHELVRSGPYAIVRHPIYTGMLGLLVATALTLSAPVIILPGIALFVVGTLVRTRAEERLLRSAFGAEFETYFLTVPALIPWRAFTPVRRRAGTPDRR